MTFDPSIRTFSDSNFTRRAQGSASLGAGSANIAIHEVDVDSDFAPTGRGIYLDLLADDLTAARSALRAGSVPILKEWRDHNGEFLLVADPDGNLLEIYQANADEPS